jgi:hypothetical protein
VYLPSEDHGNAVFAGVGGYRRLIDPGKPSFFSRTAIRWDRPPVIVLAEMASADFILFEPVSPPAEAARVLRAAFAPDFPSEKRLVRSWLTGLDPSSSGVAVRSETSLRLLEITDRERFDRAVDGLRDRDGWREIFEEANPRRWLTGEGMARELSGGTSVAGGFRFGGRFSLEGLEMRRDENGLILDLFWKSLEEARLDGIVFLHVVNAEGVILAQGDYGQDSGKRAVRKDACWRDRVRVPEENLKGRKPWPWASTNRRIFFFFPTGENGLGRQTASRAPGEGMRWVGAIEREGKGGATVPPGDGGRVAPGDRPRSFSL